MAKIPEEVIRSILDAVDVADVVSRYVTLKRSGTSFKGLCPFHEEKTPSFHVFPQSGRFKCFGCGEGGDVIAFLMRRANLEFREVLEELSRETGIALPVSQEPGGGGEAARLRGEALDALSFANGFFRAVLGRPAGDDARAYLEGRGFEPETLATFEVGFAPKAGLLDYARKKRLSDAALLEAGLVKRNERGPYDFFRGRITFPIHDARGRVIGFGARAMGDAQPKYLNSPDGRLFHKGREMYGLHVARGAAADAGRLILVEGYTDVMHCWQAGLRETAAALGTALTHENAAQMRRFGVPVLLVYDGDEAGRRAAERAADTLLAGGVEASVALLPPGRDPADLVVEEGPEALERALEGARDLWHYRLERAVERHGLEGLESREKVVRDLQRTLEGIADPIRRDLAFKLLSERVGVPESTIRNQVRAAPGSGPGPASAGAPSAWARAEGDILAAAVSGLDWERIEEAHPPGAFQDPDLRRVAEAARNLRRQGESLTREALLGVLADDAAAMAALQRVETDDRSVARAEAHLQVLARARRVREAKSLADVVKEKGGTLHRATTPVKTESGE